MVIAAVTIQTSISLGVSIFLLVEGYAFPDAFSRRGTLKFQMFMLNYMFLLCFFHVVTGAENCRIPEDAAKYLLIISVALLLPLVAMVYQLALFHITLLSRGLTTYDFIVLEQKKAREREEQRRVRREGGTKPAAATRNVDRARDSNSWDGRNSKEEKSDREIALTSVAPPSAAVRNNDDDYDD